MATSARSTPVTPPSPAGHDGTADLCRVRVAVRIRPKNADELAQGADFDSCVELQPESKTLKLKKNNRASESYQFDDVFSENASQEHIYEVVAKPVVEEIMSHELKGKLSNITEEYTGQVHSLEERIIQLISEKDLLYEALKSTQEKMQDETRHRQILEAEVLRLKRSCTAEEGKLKETLSSQRGIISKIFEEVALPNVLAMLKSKEPEVQILALKVVANLSTNDINQEKIAEEGGLDILLSLLETSENTVIHRAIAGSIANLAMNVSNQGLIMVKGGARLLANIASKTDDIQTKRMVAGAIANLCGNEKSHLMLIRDGGIKALLGMSASGHNDVMAQIARALANFAKCESRLKIQGHGKGRSLLTEDGVLTWIVANSTMFSPSTRRHIELAFCYLAQNEENSRDIIVAGGIKELLRISSESSREDVRELAKKALSSNPAFLKEIP